MFCTVRQKVIKNQWFYWRKIAQVVQNNFKMSLHISRVGDVNVIFRSFNSFCVVYQSKMVFAILRHHVTYIVVAQVEKSFVVDSQIK